MGGEEEEIKIRTDRLGGETGRDGGGIPVLAVIKVDTAFLGVEFGEFGRILDETEGGREQLEALPDGMGGLDKALLFLVQRGHGRTHNGHVTGKDLEHKDTCGAYYRFQATIVLSRPPSYEQPFRPQQTLPLKVPTTGLPEGHPVATCRARHVSPIL